MITTFGWGGPPVLILDENPGAAGAYSLRKLSGGYNGPAIRIRRSSDNAEQDIYFTDTFNFDITAFNSFVGSDTAYVKTWYDQTGNGMHVTQTTTANQPTCNGTEVVFAGSPQRLVCSSWDCWAYTGDGSMYLVASTADKTSGNVIGYLWTQTNSTGTNGVYFSVQNYPNGGWYGTLYDYFGHQFAGANDHTINQYYVVNTQWINYSTFMTNGNTKIYFNGVEQTTYQLTGSGNPSSLSSGLLYIGSSTPGFAPYFFKGKMKELIFYPKATNNTLNSNIQGYYSI
jgi:hypothetical protein